MSKTKIPHAQYIAQKDDIPVASRLGFLLLRREYKGKESTPDQIAKAFSLAEELARAGFETPFVDDKNLKATPEFYKRARDVLNTMRHNPQSTPLSEALDDLQAYCERT